MPFSRVWDASCPRVWSEWEGEGARWVVQDLDPADDHLAAELFVEHFMPHEKLLSSLECHKDEASIKAQRKFWRHAVSQRTSLGCYRTEGTKRELVGVNACVVRMPDDPAFNPDEWESEKFIKVATIMGYTETKYNLFEELGVDKYLSGAGLLVVTHWRGRGIGKRLLNAREPMCRALGVRATATVFTVPTSQHEAATCGFSVRLQLTIHDIRKIGLDFPLPDDYNLKLMLKKYD